MRERKRGREGGREGGGDLKMSCEAVFGVHYLEQVTARLLIGRINH